MATGVLGMARMMRAFFPHALASASIGVPAAMESIKAPGFFLSGAAKLASAAASPFSTCGLIATTQTDGLRFTSDGAANREIFFAFASLRSSGDGLGSTTWMDLAPLLSQPLSRAESMRPAPIRRTLTGSRLAGALQHRRRHRLFRGLATPEHELEGGVVMLAGFQRQVEQRLTLGGAGLGIGEDHGMAEDDGAVLGPQVEMADPQLGVHMHQEVGDILPPHPFADPHVEGAGQMQRLQVLPPGKVE